MALQNSLDEMLVKHIGQLGWGQMRIVLVASLFWLPNALAFLGWVFFSIDPVSSGQWQCTDPHDAVCAAVLSGAPSRSISQQAFCSLSPEQWRFTSKDSLAAQFSLVCGSAWKVQIANSIMFVGCFIGSGLFGALADRIGRRLPLFIATAIVVAATFTSLAAHSYWGYAATRAVIGFGAAGQSQAIFLLCTESTGPGYRGVANIFSLILFTVGEFLLVLLGFNLPNWRHLTLAVGAVNAAALLLFPLIPESARWLLCQGRTQEATALLAKLAAANGSHMPREPLMARLNDTSASSSSSSSSSICTADTSEACLISSNSKPAQKGCQLSADCTVEWADGSSSSSSRSNSSVADSSVSFTQLLRSRSILLRTAVLLITWLTVLLTYYGIALGSGGLPGSIYVTFSLGTAAELAAVLVAGGLVDRAGRKNCISLGLFLGGAACLACARSNGVAQAVLSAAGKFGCSVSLSVIGIFTAELFPTPVRSTAMGVCNMASRAGSIAAPFLLMAGAQLGGRSAVLIPYLAFGSMSLLAGLLVLALPETLGVAMPETMQDMAALQSLFAAKPWRQGCGATLAFLFRRRASGGDGVACAAAAPILQPTDALEQCEAGALTCGQASGAAGGPGDCWLHDESDVPLGITSQRPGKPDEQREAAGCGRSDDGEASGVEAEIVIVPAAPAAPTTR